MGCINRANYGFFLSHSDTGLGLQKKLPLGGVQELARPIDFCQKARNQWED
jgi:hypothetical protein